MVLYVWFEAKSVTPKISHPAFFEFFSYTFVSEQTLTHMKKFYPFIILLMCIAAPASIRAKKIGPIPWDYAGRNACIYARFVGYKQGAWTISFGVDLWSIWGTGHGLAFCKQSSIIRNRNPQRLHGKSGILFRRDFRNSALLAYFGSRILHYYCIPFWPKKLFWRIRIIGICIAIG